MATFCIILGDPAAIPLEALIGKSKDPGRIIRAGVLASSTCQWTCVCYINLRTPPIKPQACIIRVLREPCAVGRYIVNIHPGISVAIRARTSGCAGRNFSRSLSGCLCRRICGCFGGRIRGRLGRSEPLQVKKYQVVYPSFSISLLVRFIIPFQIRLLACKTVDAYIS